MIYNRFSLLLFLRLGPLFFLLLGIALTRLESKWFFSNLILGLLVILITLELIRFINGTNFDLIRLLQALQKDDFATHFQTNFSLGLPVPTPSSREISNKAYSSKRQLFVQSKEGEGSRFFY
jgi:hypothetical protein